MAGHKILVVLSGGMDSATCLALADNVENQVFTLSFAYGQRHHPEVQAAKALADFYGYPHRIQTVSLGRGGVIMERHKQMPHKSYAELQDDEGPSPTYVPYRNGSFLSLAASYALEEKCDLIYAGMHADDAHNWAYPDCTPEFIGAMQNAIYIGTYHKVRLVAPLTYMTKAEIVKRAVDLAVPLQLTLTCYEGTRPACGRCPACVSRLEAFRTAGFNDPLEYKDA